MVLKTTTADIARTVLKNLRALPLHLHPGVDYLDDALTIGIQSHLAIYDSLYIALASGLGIPLITADGKQERTAIAAGVRIKPIAHLK